MTTKPLREIRFKSLTIRFFVKKQFTVTPVIQVKVQTGFIPVSTPEATALDLIRYAGSIGGMDRVLTVLNELGEVMNAPKLVEVVKGDENLTYAQRLGWLLEKAGYSALIQELSQWINEKNPLPAKLEPSLPIRGAKRDGRWRLIINSEVESDF